MLHCAIDHSKLAFRIAVIRFSRHSLRVFRVACVWVSFLSIQVLASQQLLNLSAGKCLAQKTSLAFFCFVFFFLLGLDIFCFRFHIRAASTKTLRREHPPCFHVESVSVILQASEDTVGKYGK